MQKLKLLTLNLHCLVEENLFLKQQTIAEKIAEYDMDIIFLQEVAQTQKNPIHSTTVKTDNYGLVLQQLLKNMNKIYYLYFEPIKQSFGKYDEGVAFLSKHPITYSQSKIISKTNDYNDWKMRKILVYYLPLETQKIYLATTHFGWSDGYEVFEEQVDQALLVLPKQDFTIIAGDFNITPQSKEYRYILEKGLLDVFQDDPIYFKKPTHKEHMDIHTTGTRIDYIMTNQKVELLDKEILFIDQPVSDHFGVYIEIKL